MTRLDVEAIRAEVRALDYVRGTPAEIALWREGDAEARANLAIEGMDLDADEHALFDMLRAEAVPPPLAVAARNDDRPELQYRAVFGSHCVRRIDAGNARSVRQKPHSVRPTRNADPLAYGRQKAVVSARAAFRAGMVEYRRPPSEGHNRSVLTLETAAALARTEL